ncbi:hypothetical protein C9439_04405 [archaeon SCG-AAA382B04]|nr:hypothetical protein C9439_04405 [archaeon SCG-AAA382B04]
MFMIDKILANPRSQTKKKIINQLLKEEKTLTELHKQIEISKQALLKHLNKMEKKDIIKSKEFKSKKAREKKYKLNNFSALISINKNGFATKYTSNSPINPKFPLINQIPQKKYREPIKHIIKKTNYPKKPITIIIFGSVAHGDATWKSDIDIAYLSKKWKKDEKNKIIQNLSEININQDIEAQINPTFLTYQELQNNAETLHKEIKKDGILVFSSREKENLWNKLKRYKSL